MSSSRPRRRRTLVLAVAVLSGAVVLQSALAAADGAGARTDTVGTLAAEHGDDFVRGRPSATAFVLVTDDGRRVPLRLADDATARKHVGRRVRVTTKADGSSAVAPEGREPLAAAAAAAPTGAKRLAVVLINFTNDTSQPYTPAYARGVAFTDANSVAAYYAEDSWNQMTLTGDVFGWYTIGASSTSCSYSNWATLANQAAAAAGVNLSAYDYVTYAFPPTSSCQWSGLATLPGRTSWLNGKSGMSLRVLAHELGHNLGTHHASSLSCTESGARVALSSSCTASEYGDPFTIMGSGFSRHHSNFGRANIGWPQPGNTLTVTATGDFTLRPSAVYDPAGVQALRVRRTSSTYLTLEFRQPYGSVFDTFTASDPAVNGVSVRITPDYATRSQSQLVDTTPGTTSFADAPLAVGRTLVDSVAGVSVTTTGVSSLGATVRVSFGGNAPPPPADTTPPTQPAGLAATAVDASSIRLAWGASSDNVGVTGYRVLRGGALVATVTGTAWTDSGLQPATAYAYQVVAVDAAGNASTPASASATTQPAPAADTQAPTAPSSLRASVAKKKVSLTWGAATDNVGVAGYRVFRDGKQVGTTSGTGYTDTLGGKAPTATYHVAAYDAAGNVGPASNAVTVSG